MNREKVKEVLVKGWLYYSLLCFCYIFVMGYAAVDRSEAPSGMTWFWTGLLFVIGSQTSTLSIGKYKTTSHFERKMARQQKELDELVAKNDQMEEKLRLLCFSPEREARVKALLDDYRKGFKEDMLLLDKEDLIEKAADILATEAVLSLLAETLDGKATEGDCTFLENKHNIRMLIEWSILDDSSQDAEVFYDRYLEERDASNDEE